jgi:AraC family transcriptional regulator, regulatory protein of adaptative response / methylated-DNA-[protein]-cysteine methyltransferase
MQIKMNSDLNTISIPMYYSRFKTPVGNIISCSSEEGIQMILFGDEAQEYIGKSFHNEFYRLIESKNVFLEKLEFQLDEYFSGMRKSFHLQLDLQGSDFQKKVWKIVQNIPFGETRNYKDIAIEMGGLKFTRAVANANAQNNNLLLIPCHRVIGTGNKLTGYRGGLERKRWLIQFERSFIDRNVMSTLF